MRAIIKRTKRVLYYTTSPCESDYVPSYRNGTSDLDRNALITRYRKDICGIPDRETANKRRRYCGGQKMFILDMIPEMINVIGLQCDALSKALTLDICILNQWRRDHKQHVEDHGAHTMNEWKSPAQPDATSFNVTWHMKVHIIISNRLYVYSDESQCLKLHQNENATQETSPGTDVETLCDTHVEMTDDKDIQYQDQLSKISQELQDMECKYTSELNKCIELNSEISQLKTDLKDNDKSLRSGNTTQHYF